MSPAKPQTSTAAAPGRSALQAGIDRLERSARELRGFDVRTVKERSDSRLDVLQRKANNALAETFGIGSREYRQHALRPVDTLLDTTFGDRYSIDEFRDALKEGIGQAVASLKAAADIARQRLDGAQEPAPTVAAVAVAAPAVSSEAAAPAPVAVAPAQPEPAPEPEIAAMNAIAIATAPAASASTTHRVLVLGTGGQDAVEFLAQLGLEPVVIETPSIGALDAAREVEFAVVDAASAGEPSTMLAIGFMLAVVGRSRICLLAPTGGQVPQALEGALRVTPDEGGLWRLLLAREMKRAGLDVDLNRAM